MTFVEQIDSMPTEYCYLILACIAAAGIIFRARRFTKKGLFLWDEAAYSREIMITWNLFDFVKRHREELRHADAEQRKKIATEYHRNQRGHYAYYKLWHLYLCSLAEKVFRRKDVSVAAPSLVLGAANIVIIYFPAAAMFGPAAGLAAALFLSVSGLHVLHSRSAEPEPGAALCLTLTLLFSVLHKTAFESGGTGYLFSAESVLLMAACGFSLGGVLMFNPSWISVVPPMLFAGEAAYAAASGTVTAGAFFVFTAIVMAVSALAILIFDIPFFVLWRRFPEAEVVPHMLHLSAILKNQWNVATDRLKETTDIGVTLPKWFQRFFYPDLLRRTEGVAAAACAVAGAVILFARHTPFDLMIGVDALIAAAFLTVVPLKAARACVVFLPLVCLCAAVGVTALPVWAAAPLIAWAAARGAAYAWKIGGLTSGMRRAAEFIQSKGHTDFFCTAIPFIRIYGTPDAFSYAPRSLVFMRDIRTETNLQYMVVDHHQHFPAMLFDETVDLIEKHFDPVFEAEDPCVSFYPLLAEVEYYSPNTFSAESKADVRAWNRFRLSPSERDRKVRVYDLDEFFANTNKPGLAGPVNKLLALDHIRRKEFKEALSYLQNARREMPGDAVVKYFTGWCHFEIGKRDWAMRMFRESLESGDLPENMRQIAKKMVLLNDGTSLTYEMRFGEAEPILREVLEFAPDNFDAMLYLGVCCNSLGKLDEAESLMVKLLARNDLTEEARDVCDKVLNSIKIGRESSPG